MSWQTVEDIVLNLCFLYTAYRLGVLSLRFSLKHWLRRRQHQPPRGTRPRVRLVHDDVTYDLTESLVDMGLRADGVQVWAVHGPQHLRIKLGDELSLQHQDPMPEKTIVDFRLVQVDGETARFRTSEEIQNGVGAEMVQS